MRDDVTFQLKNVEVNFECINISIVFEVVKTDNSFVYEPPQNKKEDLLNQFESYFCT